MKPLRIAVLHCAACTGKARREALGLLTRRHDGVEVFHAYGSTKNDRGYIVELLSGPTCATHGQLDMTQAQQSVPDVLIAFETTKRVQHLALQPEVPTNPAG